MSVIFILSDFQESEKYALKKKFETPNNKKLKDEEINDFTISSSISDSVDLLKKNESSPLDFE